jgi:hypothetical protein
VQAFVTRKTKPQQVQPSGALVPANRKVTLSQPGDNWEREADSLAKLALRATNPDTSGRSPTTSIVTTTIGMSSQQGQPLESSTRSFMEKRFGFDFSQVRIHTDLQAARSAMELGARAYTNRNHIFFNTDQYQPGTRTTNFLMAHELAHVVQQGQAGAASMPAILRQVAGSGTSAQTQPAPGADLRRQYIDLICEVISEIRQGIETGQTWYFEDEFLLQGDEELGNPPAALSQERREALQGLVANLDGMIQQLESGSLQPSRPASRNALRALWTARYHTRRSYSEVEPAPRGTPMRWSEPIRHQRQPGGGMRRIFHSLGGYIEYRPGSPAGMLQPAIFPTWWVVGCHTERQSAQTDQATTRGTSSIPVHPPLSHDQVVLINRGDNGEVTGWQWEPRNAEHPTHPYEWSFDRQTRQVYIMVDNRRYNLLSNGRVEAQE